MDITVRRNAFGRQWNSFEADLDIPGHLTVRLFVPFFIRAPFVTEVRAMPEVFGHT